MQNILIFWDKVTDSFTCCVKRVILSSSVSSVHCPLSTPVPWGLVVSGMDLGVDDFIAPSGIGLLYFSYVYLTSEELMLSPCRSRRNGSRRGYLPFFLVSCFVFSLKVTREDLRRSLAGLAGIDRLCRSYGS